jgi:hypothetical protein
VTPDEYESLDRVARAEWVIDGGPKSPQEEQMVLDDPDLHVRAAAANSHHISEDFLRRMYEREPDPALREVIATNPSAPLELMESVPVVLQTGAGLGAYALRAHLTDDQKFALEAATAQRPPEWRPLGEFIRSLDNAENR